MPQEAGSAIQKSSKKLVMQTPRRREAAIINAGRRLNEMTAVVRPKLKPGRVKYAGDFETGSQTTKTVKPGLLLGMCL